MRATARRAARRGFPPAVLGPALAVLLAAAPAAAVTTAVSFPGGVPGEEIQKVTLDLGSGREPRTATRRRTPAGVVFEIETDEPIPAGTAGTAVVVTREGKTLEGQVAMGDRGLHVGRLRQVVDFVVHTVPGAFVKVVPDRVPPLPGVSLFADPNFAAGTSLIALDLFYRGADRVYGPFDAFPLGDPAWSHPAGAAVGGGGAAGGPAGTPPPPPPPGGAGEPPWSATPAFPGGIPPIMIDAFVGGFFDPASFAFAGDGGRWCRYGAGESIAPPPGGGDGFDPSIYDPLDEGLDDFLYGLDHLTFPCADPPLPNGGDLDDDDWLEEEFGPTRERTPDPQAERQAREQRRQRLRTRYRELGERQERYDRIRRDLDRQLGEATDAKEKKRLRGLIRDVRTTQDTIHDQSTTVASELNQLEASEMAARTRLRQDLQDRVNGMAREATERRIKDAEGLQDIKDTATTGGRWVSTGAAMQYETRRTTRMADRELIAAEERIKAIDALLKNATPQEAEILRAMRERLVVQRDGAQGMLDANARLTQYGYAVDVGTTLCGVGVAKWGKGGVTWAASRLFAKETAESVTSTVAEQGLKELGSRALGRTGATSAGRQAVGQAGSQAGAHATSQAGTQATSQAGAQAGSQAAAGAAGASSTQALPQAAQAAASQTLPDVPREFLEQILIHEGGPLPQLSDDVLRGIERVRQRAQQNGGDIWRALDDVLEEVIEDGARNVNPANTGAVRGAADAMDQAVRTGRTSGRQWAGQRGLQTGASGPNGTWFLRQPWRGFSNSGASPNGITTLFGMSAPFIAMFMLQDGYAAEPTQGVAGGNGRLRLQAPGGQGGRVELDGAVGTDGWLLRPTAGGCALPSPFQPFATDAFGFPMGSSYIGLGLDGTAPSLDGLPPCFTVLPDPCGDKAPGPHVDWRSRDPERAFAAGPERPPRVVLELDGRGR